jgi:TRAP transporter 4TM/12TM fusion protein
MPEPPVQRKIEVNLDEEAPRGKRRQLTGAVGMAARILAIAVPAYSFLFIMNLFAPMGVFIYSGTHNALFLAGILILTFLLVPATNKAPRNRVPWYDWLLIVASGVSMVYIAVVFEDLLLSGGVGITPFEIFLGLVAILSLFEAVRRTTGWAMIIVCMFFLLHAKFAYLFPGFLNGPNFPWSRVLNYLYLSNQGIFGMVVALAATIIISFMVFGAFLDVSGAGNTFMKLALATLGHVRGGAGKVAILGSALFGTVTGSPMAEIGVIGNFTIPLMKRIGYSPTFAAATEAAAACGGVIDPPVMGVVAFVMADFTGIGYGTIAVAAIIPAVLYYLSLFFQLDLRAAKTGLAGLPRHELPRLWDCLKESWLLFPPLAVLIIWMMVLDRDPTESVYFALAALIILSLLNPKNRLTVKKALAALEDASKSMIDITPICGMAGIIVGSITLTGLGINLSSLLVRMSGGSLFALALLTFLAIRIMGMGVSTIATYVLMAVMVAPALVQIGVSPLVAHFFIFYVGVSMFIEPPFCPAAYIAAAIAGASPMRVGFQAMRLSIVAYLVPFITIYQPAMLWQGTAVEVVMAAASGIVAIYALSVGFEGYLFAPAKWWERLMWLAGGFLLFIPKIAFIAPGMVMVALGVMLQWPKRRQKMKEAAEG